MERQVFVIESSLSHFYLDCGKIIQDNDTIIVLQQLIKYYHYHEKDLSVNKLQEELFGKLKNNIKLKLKDLLEVEIVKLVATVLFYVKNRTRGKTEYLDFIVNYTTIGDK